MRGNVLCVPMHLNIHNCIYSLFLTFKAAYPSGWYWARTKANWVKTLWTGCKPRHGADTQTHTFTYTWGNLASPVVLTACHLEKTCRLHTKRALMAQQGNQTLAPIAVSSTHYAPTFKPAQGFSLTVALLYGLGSNPGFCFCRLRWCRSLQRRKDWWAFWNFQIPRLQER